MTLFLLLLALAVLGAVAAVAAGVITGGLDDPATSVPPRELPSGPVSPDDVGRLRFCGALRGYRMDQVDDAMDRLQRELARRDAELADRQDQLDQLRRNGTASPGWPAQAPAPRDEWPLPGIGRVYGGER